MWNRSHCHGNMLLNAAPKFNRHTASILCGCPNPIDVPAGTSQSASKSLVKIQYLLVAL